MLKRLVLFLSFAILGFAHMEMKSPPPFRSKFNPNSGSDVDYNMINPLNPDGSNFPCKGYESLLSSPEGAAVLTWGSGTTQTITLSGGAIHGGGSCQFSLSYDKGASWHVIHSIIGNCPSATGESSYPVTIPANMPSSQDVLFAWTWYNKIGNREVYGNCAHVVIQGKTTTDSADTALAALPDIFRANVGNGCQVEEGMDVAFPDPGSSVQKNTEGQAPKGSCGTISKNTSSDSSVTSVGTDTDVAASTGATETTSGTVLVDSPEATEPSGAEVSTDPYTVPPESASDTFKPAEAQGTPATLTSYIRSLTTLIVSTTTVSITSPVTSSLCHGDDAENDSGQAQSCQKAPANHVPGNDWPSWFTSNGFSVYPDMLGTIFICILASILVVRV